MLSFYLSLLSDPKDSGKFRKIYMEFRYPIYNYCYEILNHVEDAEDCTADVFSEAAEHFEKIKSRSNDEIKSYLMKLAYWRALNIYKKRKKYSEYANTNYLDTTNSNEFISYEKKFELKDALNSMNAFDRDCFLLNKYYGLTSKEIGKFFGKDSAYIRKRIQFARQYLKETLKEEIE